MADFNRKMQVGHGIGGGNASIDNVPFSPGAWFGWPSDEEAFFANGADGWVVAIYNTQTQKILRAIPDPSHPQFGAGANSGFAGGGVWAGWLGSRDAQRGLFTSSGLHFPDAGLLAVGPLGELAYKPSYQSGGPSLVLEKAGQEAVAAYSAPGIAPGSPEALAALEGQLWAAGQLWQLSPGSPYELQLLGAGAAIWQEGNRLTVRGLPQPLQLGKAWAPRAYLIDGRWWVSYYSDIGGIILHPFDSLDGYTISPAGVDMWYTARSDGFAVTFALFVGIGQQNGQLLPFHTVDVGHDPTRPLQPPAPPLKLPAPSRKYWAGWFEFASAPHGPGNALLAVRNIAGALDRPAIVTDETAHMVSGTLLGKFISGRTLEEIEAAAKASELRPVVYWDDRVWPGWPLLPKGSWICLQLYQEKAETLDHFKALTRLLISSAPAGYPLVLVGQQYTSNANLVGYIDPSTPPPQNSEALKPLAQALVELANETPSVIGLFLFSGYGRRSGLMDHQDLVQPWQEFAAQLSAPALEPYPPPPDPPKPEPEPPQPPSLYLKHKEYRMSQKQIVCIVGPAGKFGRPDRPNTGPWAGLGRGWRGIIFDGTSPSDDYRFELTKPDDRHQLYHPGVNCFFGADATEHSPKPGADQFFLKPASEGRGRDESPAIYEGNNMPGLLSGQVEYKANNGAGPAFVSCAFAVMVVS